MAQWFVFNIFLTYGCTFFGIIIGTTACLWIIESIYPLLLPFNEIKRSTLVLTESLVVVLTMMLSSTQNQLTSILSPDS
jgi:hypothetical protein